MIFGHYKSEVCQTLANPDLELAIQTRDLMWGGGKFSGIQFHWLFSEGWFAWEGEEGGNAGEH